jgi:hypothetical protein
MGYCCKKCGVIIEGFTELDCSRGCFDEKEPIMKYKLRVSSDLGVHYEDMEIADTSLVELKEIALKLEKTYIRWVIVDEKNDMPVYWCKYIEANLKVPKEAVIVTDDPYMAKLAKKAGYRVMNCDDMLKAIVKDPAPKVDIEWNPEEAKKASKFMNKLVSEGVIEIIPSTMDDSKVGKELFGQE